MRRHRAWPAPGLDHDGREVLTFIEGEFTQPGPAAVSGMCRWALQLSRYLHLANPVVESCPRMRCGSPGVGGSGQPGQGPRPTADVAPRTIVARDGLPVALIDWETAGPVDPLVELAQLAWLNAKLHDDVVAEREHLPPLADRSREPAAVVDAYGLTARQRRGFLDRIIEFAICDTAWEADDDAITPETTQHPIALMVHGLARSLRGLDYFQPLLHPRSRPRPRIAVNSPGR